MKDEEDEETELGSMEPTSQLLSKLQERVRGESEPAGTGADASDDGPPARIGRYPLIEEIARGGMGVVFKVHDDEMRRSLAMKVLQGEVALADSSKGSSDSQRTSRFLEEAQVTGQLEHPGIIPVHELGLDPDGRLFFTMRLVKGKTLGEVIDLTHSGRDGGWSVTRERSA